MRLVSPRSLMLAWLANEPPHMKKNSYLPFIDGLRALSVLAVVIYHLNEQWLPGGFAGVDVFFVISGYVVTGSLNKSEGTFQENLYQFYNRRFWRIFPALICMVLVTSLLVCLFTINGYMSRGLGESGLYSILGLSNLYFAFSKADYFGPMLSFNPFTHTWSLGVEEQFYLLFPLFFLLIRKHYPDSRNIFTWLIGVFGLSLLAAIVASPLQLQAQSFYLPITRIWEILAGGILFLYHQKNSINTTLGGKSSFALTAALLASFALAQPLGFPSPQGPIIVFVTVLLIHVLRTSDGLIKSKLLEGAAIVFIGKISYSLYLWHWPVITLFRWTVGLSSAWQYLACTLLSFAFALVSYYGLERNLRHNPILLNLKSKPLFLAVVLLTTGTTWFTTKLLFKNQNRIALSTTIQNEREWFKHHDFSAETAFSNECLKSIKKNLKLKSHPFVKYQGLDCKNVSKKQIFFLGDSHALAYKSLIQTLATDFNYTTYLFTQFGCTPFSFRSTFIDQGSCSQKVLEAIGYISNEMKSGDTLVLSTLKLNRFSHLWELYIDTIEPGFKLIPQTDIVKAQKEFLALMQPLILRGLKVVIEAPKPLLYAPPYRCMDWFTRTNAICQFGFEVNRDYLLHYRQQILVSLNDLKQEGVIEIWDPFPILCPNASCGAFQGDHILFSDGDHITPRANKILYQDLVKYL